MSEFLRTGIIFLCIIFSHYARADDFGRLFFTSEQRTQLSHSFQRLAPPESDQGGIVLNGIVQKHGGRRTAWINGVAQPAGKSDERSPESMPVNIPGQTKSIKLKVGQRVFSDHSGAGQ